VKEAQQKEAIEGKESAFAACFLYHFQPIAQVIGIAVAESAVSG